jgi:hypothetical protein
MNEWLDRGCFCVTWVGLMWIADMLLSNTGVITYSAMMIGAVSLVIIGLIKQYWARVTE